MNKLKVENLCVTLTGREILHDICFTAPQRAFVSILGPSGCGKSTLLKAIAGLLPPSAGRVWLDEKPADALPPHRRGAVIVFQDMRLFPHLTAAENVGFPLRMQGMPKKEYLKKATELLQRVQLGGLAGRKPAKLSGGQQQRVALARALAANPGVLLLDEPFTGLDESLREDMRALVHSLHREFGMTTLLVTHDAKEALGMSDSLVLLQEGRVLQTGSPREVYERPASREAAAYFGEAAFLPGRVQNGRFTCELFSFAATQKEGAYLAVLRPHALRVTEGGQGFLLAREQYAGSCRMAVFRHLATGREIRGELPPKCELEVGRQLGLSVEEGRACLIAQEERA